MPKATPGSVASGVGATRSTSAVGSGSVHAAVTLAAGIGSRPAGGGAAADGVIGNVAVVQVGDAHVLVVEAIAGEVVAGDDALGAAQLDAGLEGVAQVAVAPARYCAAVDEEHGDGAYRLAGASWRVEGVLAGEHVQLQAAAAELRGGAVGHGDSAGGARSEEMRRRSLLGLAHPLDLGRLAPVGDAAVVGRREELRGQRRLGAVVAPGDDGLDLLHVTAEGGR